MTRHPNVLRPINNRRFIAVYLSSLCELSGAIYEYEVLWKPGQNEYVPLCMGYLLWGGVKSIVSNYKCT